MRAYQTVAPTGVYVGTGAILGRTTAAGVAVGVLVVAVGQLVGVTLTLPGLWAGLAVAGAMGAYRLIGDDIRDLAERMVLRHELAAAQRDLASLREANLTLRSRVAAPTAPVSGGQCDAARAVAVQLLDVRAATGRYSRKVAMDHGLSRGEWERACAVLTLAGVMSDGNMRVSVGRAVGLLDAYLRRLEELDTHAWVPPWA